MRGDVLTLISTLTGVPESTGLVKWSLGSLEARATTLLSRTVDCSSKARHVRELGPLKPKLQSSRTCTPEISTLSHAPKPETHACCRRGSFRASPNMACQMYIASLEARCKHEVLRCQSLVPSVVSGHMHVYIHRKLILYIYKNLFAHIHSLVCYFLGLFVVPMLICTLGVHCTTHHHSKERALPKQSVVSS